MNRLRFLHIPKTAGSTFTGCLAYQYFGKSHFGFTGHYPADINRLMSLSASKRQKIELFTGHAPILTGIDIADNAKTITFLREPVSRVKSFIQHIAEGKSPEYLTGPFDLDQFLESGIADLSNLQTRMLINKGSFISRSLMDTISKSEARDMALNNLFNVVSEFGIQEYFDESLVLFARSLNWSIPYYISVNKKNTKRLVEFKQQHLDRIAELNSIDTELYVAAKAKFLSIIERANFDNTALNKLKQNNSSATPHNSILNIRHTLFRLRRRIWNFYEVAPSS